MSGPTILSFFFAAVVVVTRCCSGPRPADESELWDDRLQALPWLKHLRDTETYWNRIYRICAPFKLPNPRCFTSLLTDFSCKSAAGFLEELTSLTQVRCLPFNMHAIAAIACCMTKAVASAANRARFTRDDASTHEMITHRARRCSKMQQVTKRIDTFGTLANLGGKPIFFAPTSKA